MNEEKNQNHEEKIKKDYQKFAQTKIFSDIKGLFEMIPWVPFIFTTVVVFLITLLVQVIYYYTTDPNKAITYGAIMVIFLWSLGIAVSLGFIVKFIVKVGLRNKFKSFGLFNGRMKISIGKRDK